jgi:recombinational DNA repair protein RecR
MSEEKDLRMETVNLLRAVMKLSSALNNLDNLSTPKNKYLKYNFKRKAKDWATVMEKQTSELMVELFKEDETLLMEIYDAFDKCDTVCVSDDEDRQNLVIFYVKLKSAMWDIEQMQEYRNTMYPYIISFFTGQLLTQIEKQYADIPLLRDAEGKHINEVIKYYNEVGEKIMHYSDGAE